MKFLVESLQRLNQKPKPPQRLLKVNPLRNRNNYFRIGVNLFRKRVNNVRLLRNDIRKRVNLFQYKVLSKKWGLLYSTSPPMHSRDTIE